MSEIEYSIRQPDGSVQGPFPESRIRAWIEQGRVRREMEFSTDGATWMPGADVPGLFPDLTFPDVPVGSTAPAMPPPPPQGSEPPAPAPVPERRSRSKAAPAPARGSRRGGGGREPGGRAAQLSASRAERKRVLRGAVLPFAIAAVALGTAAAVCAFLPFTSIEFFGESIDIDGIDSNTGRYLIILALGGAVSALLALAGQNGRITMLVAAVALAGAAVLVGMRIGSPDEWRETFRGHWIGGVLAEAESSTQPARYAAIGSAALGAVLAFIGSMRFGATERAWDRAQRDE